MNTVQRTKLFVAVLGVVLLFVASAHVQAQVPERFIGQVVSVDAVANVVVIKDLSSGEELPLMVDRKTVVTIPGEGRATIADLLAEQTVLVICDPDTSFAHLIHVVPN